MQNELIEIHEKRKNQEVNTYNIHDPKFTKDV